MRWSLLYERLSRRRRRPEHRRDRDYCTTPQPAKQRLEPRLYQKPRPFSRRL